MTRLLSCFVFSIVIFTQTIYCQTGKKNNMVYLYGRIMNRDTGYVILSFFDKNDSSYGARLKLTKGQFHFFGAINRGCEALLWTNLTWAASNRTRKSKLPGTRNPGSPGPAILNKFPSR